MALDFGGTGIICESIQRTLWRPDNEYPILCRLCRLQVTIPGFQCQMRNGFNGSIHEITLSFVSVIWVSDIGVNDALSGIGCHRRQQVNIFIPEMRLSYVPTPHLGADIGVNGRFIQVQMSQETLVGVSIREMKLFIYMHCLLSDISEEF